MILKYQICSDLQICKHGKIKLVHNSNLQTWKIKFGSHFKFTHLRIRIWSYIQVHIPVKIEGGSEFHISRTWKMKSVDIFKKNLLISISEKNMQAPLDKWDWKMCRNVCKHLWVSAAAFGTNYNCLRQTHKPIVEQHSADAEFLGLSKN